MEGFNVHVGGYFMGVSAESVRVTICGQELVISADTDEETIKRIAAFVDIEMRKVLQQHPVRDNYRSAILCTLNIAGQLHELKEKYNALQKQLSELHHKVLSINTKLENTINP